MYACRRKRAPSDGSGGDNEPPPSSSSEQLIAAKFISKTLTDSQRAMYEVNVMTSLEHLALVPLLGAYSEPRDWVIVMPL